MQVWRREWYMYQTSTTGFVPRSSSPTSATVIQICLTQSPQCQRQNMYWALQKVTFVWWWMRDVSTDLFIGDIDLYISLYLFILRNESKFITKTIDLKFDKRTQISQFWNWYTELIASSMRRIFLKYFRSFEEILTVFRVVRVWVNILCK